MSETQIYLFNTLLHSFAAYKPLTEFKNMHILSRYLKFPENAISADLSPLWNSCDLGTNPKKFGPQVRLGMS